MIDILLASYNGEKYIAEQIDSILSQTYEDWFLYIKDDCSTDNTVNIIRGYEKRYKDKIKVVLSDKPSGSAKNNFFSMLQYSKSDYIMTCDQDDVWIPEKVKITYNKMKQAENRDKDIPILVHTDLIVVDENLNTICDSLFKMQNLDSNRDKLNNLLVQNIVTGCTVMINRRLLDYIETVPTHAIMHDWWMALVASALGKIIFVGEQTVLYRQHNDNDVGAKQVNSANYILKRLSNINNIKKSIKDTYLQAGDVLNHLGNYLDENNYIIVKVYSQITKLNKFKKILMLIKYKLLKNSKVRVLGQIIFC